jgi:uncharacterized membrane protein
MDILAGLGLAVPAGLNAYIPLLTVAVAQRLGWIRLDEPFALLGEWWAIALIVVLMIVEMAADKVPAIDSVNDTVQTVVRPAAGGLLFAAANSGDGYINPIVYIVAGVLVAGGVHAVKATARPVANTATGGAAAPVLSTIEDIVAVVLSVMAILVPVLAGIAAIALVVVLARRFRRAKRSGPETAAIEGSTG